MRIVPNSRPTVANLRADITAGFLVFLIALPLSLGIAMASGFPPVSGLLTAIIGGVLGSFVGRAPLTIKGPAAGLIVIVVSAVSELGQGDPVAGYRKTLAVGVVAAALQIVLAITRAGLVGYVMPPSVVHGMLAAIGVIIFSKQFHTLLGVTPEGRETVELLLEIPRSLAHLDPAVTIIGLISLALLFGLAALRSPVLRRIPPPVAVLACAVPLGAAFGFGRPGEYVLGGTSHAVGPHLLVNVPDALAAAVTFPDFSEVFAAASLKYIVMFALVGTVESLLTVAAVDAIDPAKRSSDLNGDLRGIGIANLLSSFVGGLPMISEIVRSKANLDAGATSRWGNFFHGVFLFGFVVLLPSFLRMIPLAALAAMLVYTGTRLASPQEFKHALHLGREQLVLFLITMLVTLATDLLIGVAVGIATKLVMHVFHGARPADLFNLRIDQIRRGEELVLTVTGAAVFTTLLPLRRRLANLDLDGDVRRVVLDFHDVSVIDHTVFEKIHAIADEWPETTLVIRGLEHHVASSHHRLAARWKARSRVIGGKVTSVRGPVLGCLVLVWPATARAGPADREAIGPGSVSWPDQDRAREHRGEPESQQGAPSGAPVPDGGRIEKAAAVQPPSPLLPPGEGERMAARSLGSGVYKPMGGLAFSSTDGRWSLNLSLWGQLLYTATHGEAVGGEPTTSQSLQVRRARLVVSGTAFSPHFKHSAHFQFAPRDLGLSAGSFRQSPVFWWWVAYDKSRDFVPQLGFAFVPYSRQRLEPPWKLQFVDNSIAAFEFGFDRDIGVQLKSADLGGVGKLRYAFGVMMGDGYDFSVPRDFGMQYVARFEVLPFGLFDDYAEADFERRLRPKLALAGAYSFVDGDPRNRPLGNPPADGGTTDTHNATVDMVFHWAGWSVLADFYWRSGRRNPGGAMVDDGMGGTMPVPTESARNGIGFTAQTGFLIPKIPLEIAGRYAKVRGVRRTSLVDLDEVGPGLSWYVARHALKVQLDYFHQFGSIAQDRVRAQLTFAF